jgi:hypothetical protein
VRTDIHLIAIYGGFDHCEQTSAVVVQRKRARDVVGGIDELPTATARFGVRLV